MQALEMRKAERPLDGVVDWLGVLAVLVSLLVGIGFYAAGRTDRPAPVAAVSTGQPRADGTTLEPQHSLLP